MSDTTAELQEGIAESLGDKFHITAQGHLFITIFGVVLLILIVSAVRYELKFLSSSRTSPFVRGLSFLSFGFMGALSIVCIFHFPLSFPWFVSLVGTLAIVLLIITPVQLVYRTRSFHALKEQRIIEKAKLIRDMTNIIDESKREKHFGDDTADEDRLPDNGESHSNKEAEGPQ